MITVDDLDPVLRADALERADEARRLAATYEAMAKGARVRAEDIEKSWMIPPPCHLCGRRECAH